MQKHATVAAWQRSVMALSGAVIGVLVISALYLAQVVFIPVGMALFLTFLLTPMVRGLQRRGLGRTPAVIAVVLCAAVVVGGGTWIVGRQFTGLLAELPDYSTNITGKIKAVRAWGAGSARLGKLIEEVGGELNGPTAGAPGASEGSSLEEKLSEAKAQPAPVVLEPKTPAWLAVLPAYLSSVIESVGSLALALVLVVFMLINREDLRNRFLRLAGQGRMSSTTRAVDDAGQRISQYLLMQLIVNATFGFALMLGLFAIGVEYAPLWGVLATVLRYIPYIGAWVAAAFPIILSLAMFDSWWAPAGVIALVLTLELVSNNVMEPWLYGQSMGVSPVAQIVSAAFWAFLWGPIGLVLSAPLTVVLLVLGKYVPQLEFLDVLLGDEPVLKPDVIYYQRLLARDQDEAAQLVLSEVKSGTADAIYDELLIPALNNVKRDHDRDEVSDADLSYVLQTTLDILEDLGERRSAAVPSAVPEREVEEAPREAPRRIRVLGCPARDEGDRLALVMLQQLLDPEKWEVEVAAVEALTSELMAQVASEGRTVVCIGSLPPGGLAHTRYLCKRLRIQFPRVKIVVGRWGLRGNLDANRDQIQEAGADMVATALLETRQQLDSWYSVLAHQEQEALAG